MSNASANVPPSGGRFKSIADRVRELKKRNEEITATINNDMIGGIEFRELQDEFDENLIKIDVYKSLASDLRKWRDELFDKQPKHAGIDTAYINGLIVMITEIFGDSAFLSVDKNAGERVMGNEYTL